MACLLVQLVQYLPNFYFGSLLLLFGVEILSDWLLFSWAKVTKKEYLLLWATFIAVMFGMHCPLVDQGYPRSAVSYACLMFIRIQSRFCTSSVCLKAVAIFWSWLPC